MIGEQRPLGRTELMVPQMGVGAMTWGQPTCLARLQPAKTAYGGANGPDQERLAFAASMTAGVVLFDTAELYSGGASERRLGELAAGTDAIIATKFPPGLRSRAEDLPGALDSSRARLRRTVVDLYQHHYRIAARRFRR